jgi:UDP-GlcNAc:undecaprenyl-phosphate GlcNAc-1-phosphate transferase
MPQAVLFATVVSAALMGLVIAVAERRRWAGDVGDGVQRFHGYWVTRLGGLAILLALALWLAFAPQAPAGVSAVLWLSCLLPAFAAGLAEDCTRSVGAWPRLVATFAGAALAWSLLDVQIVRLGPDWLDARLAELPLLSLALTVLFVGGMPHAVNLIDGYNGLAGTYALLTLLAIASVAGAVGDAPLACVALGAAAATGGFLLWNFPGGRIFLGDGGAYLLGTVIAFLAVRLVRDHPQVAPTFAALLVAYPTCEVLFSIWRKVVRRGGSAFEPDGVHLHMLLYKRLARSCRAGVGAEEARLRNAATTLYAMPLLLGAVVPALLWWGDATTLTLAALGLAFAYLRLYASLARFGMPAVLRLPAAPWEWAWEWAAKQADSAATLRSSVKRLATRARPARPSRARSAASASNSAIACVSRDSSPGGTSTPAPLPASSATAPTAVAMTGTPAAMASIRATGIPSMVLARITASTARRR